MKILLQDHASSNKHINSVGAWAQKYGVRFQKTAASRAASPIAWYGAPIMKDGSRRTEEAVAAPQTKAKDKLGDLVALLGFEPRFDG